MSDEPAEEEEGEGSLVLQEGEVYIWDPAALLDEYQADAIRIHDGEIWVLKEKSRKWVRVEPIKPSTAGKVRPMKGTTEPHDAQ